MKKPTQLLATALFGLCAVSFGASAQTTGAVKSEDQIKADYKAAKDKCDALSGKEETACEKRAQADRESAEADAKVGKAEAEAKKDVADDRRDAEYDAAVAQCDTLSGDAEDKCKTEAKTKFNK